MSREVDCLRCGLPMKYLKRDNIHMGKSSWFGKDVANRDEDAIPVDMYVCRHCGKIEFFQPEGAPPQEDCIAQVRCPDCGQAHDMDLPKCPFCKRRYGSVRDVFMPPD